jgi:hypothetical protein
MSGNESLISMHTYIERKSRKVIKEEYKSATCAPDLGLHEGLL